MLELLDCAQKTVSKETDPILKKYTFNFFISSLCQITQKLLLEPVIDDNPLKINTILNLNFFPILKSKNYLYEYYPTRLFYELCVDRINIFPENSSNLSAKIIDFSKKKLSLILKIQINSNSKISNNVFVDLLKEIFEKSRSYLINNLSTLELREFLDKLDRSKKIIKSSLHLENQKFGRKPKINEEQLDLFPNIVTQAKEIKVEVIGLNFQPSHYQALGAIQNLLAKTNYDGNAEGTYLTRDTNSFKFEGKIPRIKFSRAQYLEMYGVKKYITSRNKMEFGGKESVIALDALQYLGTQPHLIIATRRRWQNRVEVVDRYQTLSPILRICEGWEGLTPIENKSLDEGAILESINCKHRGFVIEPCPLLIDQLESYFVLKPANIYQEIKLKFPNASRFAYTFIDWIVKEATLKKINSSKHSKLWPEKIEIGLETLSYILRMDGYIKSRNWKKINTSIKRCVEVAISLQWLLKHESVEGKTIYKKEIFFLNKEKFNQISSK